MTTDEVAANFLGYSLNGDGSSPLYERLSAIVARHPELLDLMQAAPVQQRYPTLFFAALHFLVLGYPDRQLALWYPSVTGAPVPAEDPSEALLSFCENFAGELRALIGTRATQTNEVARCAALLPAFALAACELESSLALIELGTSAGLNLLFDRYAYDYHDGGIRGRADGGLTIECQLLGDVTLPQLDGTPPVASAVGLDLHPVDVRDREAARWLRACVFADQPTRGLRLQSALDIARRDPPTVLRGDLLTETPRLIANTPAQHGVCVFHSWILQYLTAEERSQMATQMAECGRHRALAWISIEPPGTIPGLAAPEPDADAGPAALLTLTLFRAGRRSDRVLARTHPHLAWMEWLDAGTGVDARRPRTPTRSPHE